MKVRIHAFVCVSLVALFACHAVAAQDNKPRRVELFAEGGASTINDKSNENLVEVGTGASLILVFDQRTTHIHPAGRLFTGVRLWINPEEALEVSYSYALSNTTQTVILTQITSSGSNTAVGRASASVRANFYSFNYVRKLRADHRWQPSFTAGIGGVHWVAIRGAQFPDGFANGFVGNFGAGIDYKLSRRWALRAEYRDFLMEHPRFTAALPSGLSHNQAPTLGFVYRF